MNVAVVACSAEDSFVRGTYESVVGPDGGIEVEFRPDGRYLVSDSGGVLDEGTFTVDGGSLSFESRTACERIGHGHAIYWWTWDDGVLEFRSMSGDGCELREQALAPSFRPRAGGPTTAT